MARPGRYMSDRRFNSKQLAEGIEVELEHTRSINKAKAIAKDHLAEHPRYYVALEKMEKRLKGRRKRPKRRTTSRAFPWQEKANKPRFPWC